MIITANGAKYNKQASKQAMKLIRYNVVAVPVDTQLSINTFVFAFATHDEMDDNERRLIAFSLAFFIVCAAQRGKLPHMMNAV